MRAGSGWDQRMPWVSMTVMKETPVSWRTCSAYGWMTALGSGPVAASRTVGESASDRATVVAWRRTESSYRCSVKRYARTAPPATTAATMTICTTNSCPARLRSGRRRGGFGGTAMSDSVPGPGAGARAGRT